MDKHWEEGCWGQGEWNDNEHQGKEEVPWEWKKYLDSWRGWIRDLAVQRVSHWREWNEVVK
jgi:hypothetical protein